MSLKTVYKQQTNHKLSLCKHDFLLIKKLKRSWRSSYAGQIGDKKETKIEQVKPKEIHAD